MRVACLVGVLAASTGVAHADQLGFDFGGGPVVATNGSLTETFTPVVYARFGVVGHRGAWAGDLGMVAMNAFAERGQTRSALGGTVGIRRYHPLASTVRNGVLVRLQTYGAVGWMVGGLTGDAPTTLARTVAESDDGGLVHGPRLGVGLELSLSQRTVWSRIGLDVNHQTLGGPTRSGGYAYAQLVFTTSFGH